MDGLMKISADVLDIAARLKEIDPRYEVYRNLKLHRFEIYADGVLQIAVPFGRLDGRTLELVRETRAERAEELLSRLDAQNARLREEAISAARDRAEYLKEEAI